MGYNLNNFQVKDFENADTAVTFEIESDTKVIKFSEVLNSNRTEDAELILAIEKFVYKKVGDKT